MFATQKAVSGKRKNLRGEVKLKKEWRCWTTKNLSAAEDRQGGEGPGGPV